MVFKGNMGIQHGADFYGRVKISVKPTGYYGIAVNKKKITGYIVVY